jgi:hypothetical protein
MRGGEQAGFEVCRCRRESFVARSRSSPTVARHQADNTSREAVRDAARKGENPSLARVDEIDDGLQLPSVCEIMGTCGSSAGGYPYSGYP